MTTTAEPASRSLTRATEELLEEYADIPATRVLAAVARARVHVDDGHRIVQLEMPPADIHLAMVLDLARQELDKARAH